MKSYIKSNWFFLLVVVGSLVFYYIKRNASSCIVFGFLLAIFAIENYNKNKRRRAYLVELEQRGLTEKMAEQINFIQEWESIVKKGVVYYCLLYKGIPFTVLFTLFFAFLFLIVASFLSKLFLTGQILVVSIISGYILGVMASKFLWSVNQKKFARLTNAKQ